MKEVDLQIPYSIISTVTTGLAQYFLSFGHENSITVFVIKS